jgi:hypothetical protein
MRHPLSKYSFQRTGNGSKRLQSDGIDHQYQVIDGSDVFTLKENDAGIYIEITMQFGDILCTDRLYGMNKDDPEFWLYEREWAGSGHKPGGKVTYMRDKKFPIGKQVLLGTRKATTDAAK